MVGLSLGLFCLLCSCSADLFSLVAGGKMKPLKAPKKDKKDLDDDDLAFKEKQRAGWSSHRVYT